MVNIWFSHDITKKVKNLCKNLPGNIINKINKNKRLIKINLINQIIINLFGKKVIDFFTNQKYPSSSFNE